MLQSWSQIGTQTDLGAERRCPGRIDGIGYESGTRVCVAVEGARGLDKLC